MVGVGGYGAGGVEIAGVEIPESDGAVGAGCYDGEGRRASDSPSGRIGLMAVFDAAVCFDHLGRGGVLCEDLEVFDAGDDAVVTAAELSEEVAMGEGDIGLLWYGLWRAVVLDGNCSGCDRGGVVEEDATVFSRHCQYVRRFLLFAFSSCFIFVFVRYR